MLFNSLSYFLFLPVVVLIHYFTPDRFRWFVLLVASFCFYAALKAPHLITVLLLITTITYFTGIWIDRCENPRTNQYILWGGISANVLTLIILKYLPFITQNLNIVLNHILPGVTIPVGKTIVAIGASYFIFQAISYLIDIYLDVEKPERHYGYFALYMSFFPKLLQGPIEGAGDLLPQLRNKYEFNYNNMRVGLLMIAGGLFKKIVIADRLALYVNPVYDNVRGYSGVVFIIVTYLYALQLYFDFSGYTDIALGTGRLFNLNLTQNFNSPYLATSIADFWRRWHISFSRWILDYIFKPIQMKLRDWKSVGTAIAMIVTFFISGIWHGASWCFIVWGLLHGVYLGTSALYRPLQRKMHKKLGLEKTLLLKIWQIFITFHLVCFAWIFFRANSISDAWYIVTHMIFGVKNVMVILLSQKYDGLMVTITSLFFMYITWKVKNKLDLMTYLFQKPIWLRWVYYHAILLAILFFGVYDDSKFIYFKF